MKTIIAAAARPSAIFLLAALALAAAAAGVPPGGDTLSLAGEWAFRLDPGAKGEAERWFAASFDDRILLPGTTDENGKGTRIDERRDDRLSRVYDFKGPAWYRRRVRIPEAWRGRRISLFLERTKFTRVWLDEADLGAQDGLSAPQTYVLHPAPAPGEHTLTIMVDNSRVPPVGPAHALDERTQTNWNGLLGRLELRATPPVWIDDIQVYPLAAKRSARVRLVVGNAAGRPVRGTLTLRAESRGSGAPARYATLTLPIEASGPATTVEAVYELGSEAPLWDEFRPAMIALTAALEAGPPERAFEDRRTVAFGLREFEARGTQFAVNGRTVFLRGKNDACIFPLTGYPPMEKAGWLRVFKIAKSYGINHYRFHTWCPPEAAFQAADELGLYLQPELPNKVSFEKPEHEAYLRAEGERILAAFGNHPSFVMFTLGNELGGSRDIMAGLVAHFRNLDPRHLYAQGTNNFHWEPALAAGDDFWTTARTALDRPVRGSFYQGDYDKASIETLPPSTLRDFQASIAGVPVPVVGHETGQYSIFPDFKEIPKYTGVLRARNLEIFRDRLAAAHMLDQADDFVRASGALSVLCYREDIELALRTPGFAGFQLLDLQDFPGQGTAIVGILNAFLDPKGLIAPEAWRRFCSETVPLLRFEKYAWTGDEEFRARVQVAHFGERDLPAAELVWSIKDRRGRLIAGGTLAPRPIVGGRLNDIGDVRASLAAAAAPEKLTVEAAIAGTPYANSYDIWVYPADTRVPVPAGIRIARTWDASLAAAVREGATVVLLPKPGDLPRSVAGAFQTDFWCFPMFRRAAERAKIPVAPGTLGILCDPRHPALAGFPTEFHSDWQWWQLVKDSRPVILDGTPPDDRPIVQVIDNFERNHKLGLVFEARLGRGRILACAIDLLGLQEKPEARQLLRSLLDYAASPRFAPRSELSEETVRTLFVGESAPARAETSGRLRDARR